MNWYSMSNKIMANFIWSHRVRKLFSLRGEFPSVFWLRFIESEFSRCSFFLCKRVAYTFVNPIFSALKFYLDINTDFCVTDSLSNLSISYFFRSLNFFVPGTPLLPLIYSIFQAFRLRTLLVWECVLEMFFNHYT